MSIINIISNDELTLVQGVNGLFFCEESWVTQSRAVSRIGKVLPKEIIGTKDQSTNSEQNKLLFSFDALTSNPS